MAGRLSIHWDGDAVYFAIKDRAVPCIYLSVRRPILDYGIPKLVVDWLDPHLNTRIRSGLCEEARKTTSGIGLFLFLSMFPLITQLVTEVVELMRR